MTSSGQTAHILVVDDDPKIRLLLRRCFEPEGYQVSEADSRDSAMACLSENQISLVTLDLSLGQDDGLLIAREIRNIGSIPIIMVTGKGDTIDQVVGLEMGADDYITKPFHLREVLARVRSVLRRSELNSSPAVGAPTKSITGESYQFDGWRVDFTRLEMFDPCGETRDLTTAEFKLLETFVKHPHRVLTRDQLMDLLKGHDWSANDRSVDNQVARLRKKIETDPKNPSYLKTVRGLGYKFTVDVQSV